jgi:hypothetical protein
VGAAYAGRALFLVRNSQSSRVKMSFVTAAIENRVRRCLHSASMRAVFPDPTGLMELAFVLIATLTRVYNAEEVYLAQ